MIRILRYKKIIASFFLCLLIMQLVIPNTAHALTSGPTQPEMQGFEPVGTTEMVDLFSGDFSYNIPLMDVGGYPLNMAYHSGSGMDDEASWVGLGWSLNPGVINRQMRGIPDDFAGDKVEKELSMRNNTTTGVKLVATPEFFGFGRAKVSLSAGVFKNTYRGFGAEVGANVTVGLTKSGAGALTIGLNSNSQEGVNTNVNFAVSAGSISRMDVSPSASIGASYNSRAGIRSITLDGSVGNKYVPSFGTSFQLAAHTYTPTVSAIFNNESYTFSGSVGGEFWGLLGKVGFTGYMVKQSVANKHSSKSAYGFLQAEKGKNDVNALMDFNREKDNPYSETVPYLPIPVPTYDLFSVSNQQGSSQFRAYRNGSGVFFDPKSVDGSNDVTLGGEIGLGAYFDAGVDMSWQNMTTKTNKWKDDNDYLGKGDFQQANTTDPFFEPAYFKQVGEQTKSDPVYHTSLGDDAAVGVNISQKGENTRALGQFRFADKVTDITQPIRRTKRDARNQVFSYLTAKEATAHALDKKIKSYPKNKLVLNCDDSEIQSVERVNESAKNHHISEVTVTDNSGKRFIYGIPAYNKYQEEVSFSLDASKGNPVNGLADYDATDASINNNQGRERYFSKDIMPPFAHAYLLTGFVSSDYVDLTGNGITDDDGGSAVKFNYTRLGSDLGWRTPFEQNKANFNEGMLSDKRDDKASYVYGRKEIWYTHSIESKTMIALFITGDREDAMGVAAKTGGIGTVHQQYLDRIELYSKSDLKQNGANAVPIKTVHFEYDYSSCANVPNNSGNVVERNGVNINAAKGKLTLKKVYFTFGRNRSGYLNPYKFSYKQTINSNVVNYGYKQSDRWGTYKNADANINGLRNDEFPYTTQDKVKADEQAALWQMDRIDLPGGGVITASYESDDYAYVQNKRAQQMCFVTGVGSPGLSNGLINAKELLVRLPEPVSSLAELKSRYFEGLTNLYFRLYVNLDAKGHYEYVPGYGTIQNIRMVDSQTAAIELQKVEGVHPAAIASWQFLQSGLPLYAYPGNETVEEDSDFKAAIQSLLGAVQRLSELGENFNQKGKRLGFANEINLSKSWVRLCSPSLKKLGGGARVKAIRISDNWAEMSGNAGMDASYGQDYNYTTTGVVNGKVTEISSGVAAYEPMIGNDENPFRQPVPYTKKGAPLGLNSHYYIEQPMGESFFPAASVGYSRVEVRAVGADNSNNKTGYIVTEYYTAKDFPTVVANNAINPKPYKPHALLNFLKMKFKSGVVVTQGYSVMTNDMHGKPKGEAVHNRGGSMISSSRYLYKSDNQLAVTQHLQNGVLTLAPDGSLQEGRIGEDVELFTDMREQFTRNMGANLKFSFGVYPLLWFPGFYGYPGGGFNQEEREFRSTSTVKLVQRTGVLYKIIKMQNGSSISAENIAWDAESGQVLLTKTQNEFDDPVYNLNYPAHWSYEGMGHAYRNIGVTIRGFTTDTTGTILSAVPVNILIPGDELIDTEGSQQGWVMKGTNGGLKIIDKTGRFVRYNNATIKITRSGRRNMATLSVGELTALRNPIKGGKLDVTEFTQIITAKANTFKEDWPVPVGNIIPDVLNDSIPDLKCPLPYISGLFYAIAAPGLEYNRLYVDPFERQRLNDLYIFVGKQSNVTLKSIVEEHKRFRSSWFGAPYPLSPYFKDPFFNSSKAANLKFYVNNPRFHYRCGQKYYYFSPGDTVTIGSYALILKDVHPYLNDAINGYYWPNDDGAGGYYEGNSDYKDSTGSCGCEGEFGYNNDFEEKVPLVTHRFVDITRDANGCEIIPACPSPLPTIVNPYFLGMTGNWRPWQQFAYQTDRKQVVAPENTAKGGTDIRRSGAYAAFNPFWNYNAVKAKFYPTADTQWIAISEATQYNNKGIDVESKDALNRYSAAVYGYLESVPVAVASNTKYHEIGFDGFEDYNFIRKCSAWPDSCRIDGHFDFHQLLLKNILPVADAAHTGKFSLKITNPITLTREIQERDTSLPFYQYDALGRFTATPENTYSRFYPSPQKRYVASVWVKSTGINNTTDGILKVGTNLSTEPIASSHGAGPIVEGWRKVEVVFVVPENAGVFNISIDPKGGAAYIDDIRVHPYNSLMKSYVYNPSSMQLMAELDENNYATFYEYNDEGGLIRVKKETTRGIMTLKENRSVQKRN